MKLGNIETKSSLARPELIPLVGLVFQLLTFLIIVVNFESTKADERIKLPRDMLAKPPAVKPEHELVLKLAYQRNDLGLPVETLPQVFLGDRIFDIRQIRTELEQERRSLEQTQGSVVLKDVTILIRGESEVPAGLVQEVVKHCQQAGFSKFTFRTAAEDLK